jgi:hypothetical protein
MRRIRDADLLCRCGFEPIVSILPIGYLMVVEFGEKGV